MTHRPGGNPQKVGQIIHLLLRDQHPPVGVPSLECAQRQPEGGWALTPASGRGGPLSSAAPTSLQVLQRHIPPPYFTEEETGAQKCGGHIFKATQAVAKLGNMNSYLPDCQVCATHPTYFPIIDSVPLYLSFPMCEVGIIMTLTS